MPDSGSEQGSHGFEESSQIPRLVQSFNNSINRFIIQRWFYRYDLIVLRLHVQLKRALTIPIPLIHMCVNKLDPVVHTQAFNPHAKMRFPELQLWTIMTSLVIKLSLVMMLSLATRVDVCSDEIWERRSSRWASWFWR
jgi:hypothetical protein